MRSLLILAQIKLNVTSVEQFLAAAASLAEENPNIRSGVEEAGREVRSASLLIEHLRNLFGHQHYIQQETSASNNNNNQFYQLQRQEEDRNSKLFTYSTQLTLVRASRSLVAQVAKILYLTDSVVLSCGQNSQTLLADNSLQLQNGALSDRLDNVANYSQLLRSFGELSAELVDLGQCLLLSQHHWTNENQYGSPSHFRWERARSAAAPAGQSFNWPAAGEQQSLGYIRKHEQTMLLLEGHSNCENGANLRPSASSYSMASQLQPASANRQLQLQLHRGSLSAAGRCQMAACQRLPVLWNAAAAGPEVREPEAERAYRRPLQDATNRVILQDDLDETSGQRWLMNNTNNDDDGQTSQSSLEADVHDMQVLFQVNRLTIDRFILLLLSASKCCLRQGDECLRGLEARRSIVGQIRASISIIMAIVKGAVFSCGSGSGTGTANNNLQPPGEQENYFSCSPAVLTANNINKSQPINNNNNNKPLIDGPAPNSAQLLFIKSHLPSANQTTRDNQFGGQHYYQQQQHQQEAQHFRWRAAAEPATSGGLPPQGDTLPEAAQLAREPLQIMDYFLRTWAGTRSANDAINKLQTLVGLFVRVDNYKQLVGALNASFLAFAQPEEGADAEAEEEVEDEEAFGGGEPPQQTGSGRSLSSNLRREFGGKASHHHMLLMNKRQLVRALNKVFLGELKSNLTERVHEFTDCPYTNHEQRESILLLLQSIRFQLNKLVKLLYKLRRRSSSVNELGLGQVRQLALQLDEACAELKCELQTVVIELSDELDRLNNQLELVKEMKHFCLVGDIGRLDKTSALFLEQTEQLIEVCKMLNQISPTNKMKLTTRSVGMWFELNANQLLACASCLAQNPRSRVLKELTWAYMQVWSSFYDDFCQIARQVAYLSHAHFDPDRSGRVAAVRDEILMRRGTILAEEQFSSSRRVGASSTTDDNNELDEELREMFATGSGSARAGGGEASSAQSLNLPAQVFGSQTDSPRSLDHYYGFGPNYQLRRQQDNSLELFRRELEREEEVERLEMVEKSSSSAGCCPQQQQSCHPTGGYLRLEENFCNFATSGNFCASPAASFLRLGGTTTNQVCQDGCCSAASGSSSLLVTQQQADQRPLVVEAFSEGEEEAGQAIRAPLPPPARKGPVAGGGHPPSSFRLPEENEQAERRRADRRNRNRNRKSKAPPSIASTLEEVAGGDSDELAAVAATTGTGSSPAAAAVAGATGGEQAADKWPEDSSDAADAIVRGAKETAQMALSMYQFTKGEGDLNTTQDLFTQAELFAEEANEIYKEVRCFSYKIPAGELKKELLAQLATIPALVQQLQFVVKNPTVGKPATFAKVDGVIRETRALMEAVNRVVSATLACRQHYNMAIASMRKRTRTLSPTYRNDKGGFEFNNSKPGNFAGRQATSGAGGGGMGSEPDI